MNVDHRLGAELEHVPVLSFDNDLILIKGHGCLFDDLRHHFFGIALRIGCDRPEVVAGGLRFRGHAVETAHMESSALWVIERHCVCISRPCPNAQMRHLELDFLPTIHFAMERIGRSVRGGGTESGR